jgi:hypothetical protein
MTAAAVISQPRHLRNVPTTSEPTGTRPVRCFEREPEIAGGLKSLGRVLLETTIDDARERRWDVPFGHRQIRRILFEDRGHRVRCRLTVERAASREHLVEHRPERKDVGAMIRGHPADLLRRHVAERAQDDAGLRIGRRGRQGAQPGQRDVGLGQLGQAEVQNLHAPVCRDEDVLRLQVAVDDALVVRRGETTGNLDRVLERLAHREGA